MRFPNPLQLSVIFLFLILSCSVVRCFQLPDKYDADVRPNNGGIADVINVAMNIFAIRDIDEEAQKLTVDFQIRTFWVDKRLSNVVERESMFVESLPKLWTPHLSITNVAEPTIQTEKSISLKNDGTLDLSERFSAKVSCPISMIRYPFGKQICQIQLNSNGYSTLHLILIWNGIISPEKIHTFDPEYSLQNIEQSSEREKTTSGEYSYINVDLHLLRSPFRIIMRALLPTFAFATLSYFITFFMVIRSKSSSTRSSSSSMGDCGGVNENGGKNDSTLKISMQEEDEDVEEQLTPIGTNSYCLPIMFEVIRVSMNAFILLLLVLINQINFLRTPRSSSTTALDVFMGFNGGIVFICFVISLGLCFYKWKNIAQEVSEEPSNRSISRFKKVRKLLRISIPVVFILFFIVYLGFCLY